MDTAISLRTLSRLWPSQLEVLTGCHAAKAPKADWRQLWCQMRPGRWFQLQGASFPWTNANHPGGLMFFGLGSEEPKLCWKMMVQIRCVMVLHIGIENGKGWCLNPTNKQFSLPVGTWWFEDQLLWDVPEKHHGAPVLGTKLRTARARWTVRYLGTAIGISKNEST